MCLTELEVCELTPGPWCLVWGRFKLYIGFHFGLIYAAVNQTISDPNNQLVYCPFGMLGNCSCCSADKSVLLIVNYHQTQDSNPQTPNNATDSVSLRILHLVYCNYLKRLCPQEGSVITFILIYSLYLYRPDPVWRKGWGGSGVSAKEGRKGGQDIVITCDPQLAPEVKYAV